MLMGFGLDAQRAEESEQFGACSRHGRGGS
jgi:hypothetical protein